MTLQPVEQPENDNLADRWKEAFAPRTWADGLFEELFDGDGEVPTATLVVMRHNLLLLNDLRRENVQQSIAATKWAGAPEFVSAAIMHMAASSSEVQQNRDAADIGTLVALIDRILASPTIPVEE